MEDEAQQQIRTYAAQVHPTVSDLQRYLAEIGANPSFIDHPEAQEEFNAALENAIPPLMNILRTSQPGRYGAVLGRGAINQMFGLGTGETGQIGVVNALSGGEEDAPMSSTTISCPHCDQNVRLWIGATKIT